MSRQAELIAYLFDGQETALSGQLLAWMEASPRFCDFAETYRDKIRKKIRTSLSPESLLDLFAELLAARRLLDDRRLEMRYEPYASLKRRGPDFSLRYRANLLFNLEVTRLRAEEGPAGGENLAQKEERVLRIVLDKLGQMQAGTPNLLAIHTRAELAGSIRLEGLMLALKQLADSKEGGFYPASGYARPADFYQEFNQLNAVLLWSEEPGGGLWVNRQARQRLDGQALRLAVGLLRVL